MTDLEMMKFAAKAAGIEVVCNGNDFFTAKYGISVDEWNPLTDDGDALRLAVKLHLHIRPMSFLGSDGGSVVVGAADWAGIEQPANGDQLSATRRAIVRAAAEIGKAMP